MSEEIEKLRKREIEERSGWCSSHKPAPLEHTARHDAPVPHKGEPVLFECTLESNSLSIRRCFSSSVSPGVALGAIIDDICRLGKKEVKAVRVYFDE